MLSRFLVRGLTFLAMTAWLLQAAYCQSRPILIRMMGGNAYGLPPKEATDPRSLARRAVFEKFHQLHPDIQVVNAGGLQLQGNDAESGFLMSMAGDTAPDVFYVNFREYYKFIQEGFCRPLDDFINQSPGALQRINPTILKVLKSFDGHIYAMPWFQVAQALYYRKDLFRKAGLDPDKPPRTWDEFYADGQKLVESKPGLYGFSFADNPGDEAYWWIDFLWQAGGEAVVPARDGYWKAAFDTPAGAKALDFFRKLTLNTWKGPDGKTYGPVADIGDWSELEREGKLAMWFEYTSDVVLNLSTINPSLIGIAALPSGPAGEENEINAGMWAINASIKDPQKLAACWKFIQYFASDQAAKVNTEKFVDYGLGSLVNPVYLKKFGYNDILGTVDPNYVKANEQMFAHGHPEPYGKNCEQVYLVMGEALDRARLEKTPSMTILKQVAHKMNQELLGYTPAAVQKRREEYATGIFVIVLFGSVGAGLAIYRWGKRQVSSFQERLPAGIDRRKVNLFVGVCVAPAALSIAIWAYFPLFKGLQIAFQDYHIMAPTRYVGLNNFIDVFTQPVFYQSIWNSFVYVFLTVGLGFFLPVALALAIDEVPRFRSFFTTIYYLPAMTSPLVISLLWKQLYDKSSTGLLNSLLAPVITHLNPVLGWFHIAPIALTHDWLGDPHLAMLAVVLPGIWAAAGPGSILYLAALKNIPQERYEAADIDGANWVQKILWITLPGIKPLMLINLLGVFIGGFKSFENIFVLTGGGPLNATHTIGLEVWTNAFLFLKFGYATAAAWVMGAILVGFTLIQVRYLMRMRFSSAKV